jgi:hypothetical protein
LLNLDSECYFGLDEVGTRMWAALTSTPTTDAAYEALLEEYDVEPEQLRADLAGFMDSLAASGLIRIVAR